MNVDGIANGVLKWAETINKGNKLEPRKCLECSKLGLYRENGGYDIGKIYYCYSPYDQAIYEKSSEKVPYNLHTSLCCYYFSPVKERKCLKCGIINETVADRLLRCYGQGPKKLLSTFSVGDEYVRLCNECVTTIYDNFIKETRKVFGNTVLKYSSHNVPDFCTTRSKDEI